MVANKAAVFTVFIGLLVASAASVVPPLIFVNRSDSAPHGLYVRTFGIVTDGDWVAVEADAVSGAIDQPLPDFLIKHIAAVCPAHVAVSDEGVWIDGARKAARPRMAEVSPFFMARALRSGELFLLNSHPLSLDSRHYGPVMRTSVKKVRLVWAW